MSLVVSDLQAFYGKSHVLQGVTLEVREGELVTLLGRNGAGKTTTLKSIVGLLERMGGEIEFEGRRLNGMTPYAIARLGIALVPEDRGIFGLLSIEENLRIAVRKGGKWGIADAYRLFPRLQERRTALGGYLSGGEQQMLAIARALVNAPKILLLDEPTEGLAPAIVRDVVHILSTLKREGMPILLVEQNLSVCIELGDRHTIIEQGRTVWTGNAAEFAADEKVRARYLTLEHA